jgi:hypothetical protein
MMPFRECTIVSWQRIRAIVKGGCGSCWQSGPDLLHAFIEPFLKGETPKGMFETTSY